MNEAIVVLIYRILFQLSNIKHGYPRTPELLELLEYMIPAAAAAPAP